MSRVQVVDLLYDGGGNLVQKVESDGAITRYVYTPAGDVATATKTKNGVSERTDFVYDAAGSLVRTTKTQL
jgi:YD repeat-containing protein